MMSEFRRISAALWTFTGLLFFSACGNLEKEILVELPDYDSQVVLECYLEPGRPFRLLLTKSASYFAPFPTQNDQFLENILEQEAEVIIRHNGEEIVLANQLSFDPETGKVYNYSSPTLVPENYGQNFELDITTQTGQTIGATTRILPVVPIDSIVILFDEENDSLARADTYLTDDAQSANFYRRSVHLGSLETEPEQDFATDDEFLDSEKFFFGTAYDYAVGDTLIFTIYHIDQTYFQFFNSIQQAILSNGNPFGQPSPIISKLEGTANAIGIFTGLSYDRVTTIIEK
jgi:hypothetical protein